MVQVFIVYTAGHSHSSCVVITDPVRQIKMGGPFHRQMAKEAGAQQGTQAVEDLRGVLVAGCPCFSLQHPSLSPSRDELQKELKSCLLAEIKS